MTNSNRRDFLKSSAIFGTGLMIGNPFKTVNKINIAVVGCGGRGSGMIFSNIPKIPSANLVALFVI